MIKTNIPVVINARNGKKANVFIEIIHQTDDVANDQYIFIIRDYIVENDQQIEIYRKEEKVSYSKRDGLKQYITSNGTFEGTESEINKQILASTLLYFVQNDVTDGKCIYNTAPEIWELVN